MNRILLNVSAAALVASSTLFFAACAVDVDRSSDKENVSGENVGALTSFKDLGEIPGTGEAKTSKYTGTPRYSAYTFFADKGDEIDVWVRGAKGSKDDAVAWVLDAKDATLGFDDDADTTTRDAHVTLTAPSAGPKAKYRVVFRDYYLSKATFTVSLVVKPALTKCAVDADCVKVKAGCCGVAYKAVNSSRADDVSCKPPFPPCAPPPPRPDDTRVALCEAETCKLVEPTDIACGGFIKSSHACPDGYFCKKEGTPMDVPGKCVAGCLYDGNTYAIGESFESSDGCNTCSCNTGGGVVCTKRACPAPTCDETKEPNRKYVGHSPAQCMLVKFACEPGTTMFSNDCGCGCEQPSDCPSFIDCMPGPGDTAKKCAELRAKCPYTPVAF